MPKPLGPVTLYVRYVKNNTHFSVGEYVNAKWRNVCEPFKVDDKDAVRALIKQMQMFTAKTGRKVVNVGYRGSDASTALTALVEQLVSKSSSVS